MRAHLPIRAHSRAMLVTTALVLVWFAGGATAFADFGGGGDIGLAAAKPSGRGAGGGGGGDGYGHGYGYGGGGGGYDYGYGSYGYPSRQGYGSSSSKGGSSGYGSRKCKECNCDKGSLVPLYRFKNNANGATLLTTNKTDPALTSDGVTYTPDPNFKGLVYGEPTPGTVPVIHYYRASSKNHFYTTNAQLEQTSAYKFVNIAFYIHAPGPGCWGEVPIYRFWNDANHLFTLDPKEATAKHRGEGTLGFVAIAGDDDYDDDGYNSYY